MQNTSYQILKVYLQQQNSKDNVSSCSCKSSDNHCYPRQEQFSQTIEYSEIPPNTFQRSNFVFPKLLIFVTWCIFLIQVLFVVLYSIYKNVSVM